jgi:hypothetical protein
MDDMDKILLEARKRSSGELSSDKPTNYTLPNRPKKGTVKKERASFTDLFENKGNKHWETKAMESSKRGGVNTVPPSTLQKGGNTKGFSKPPPQTPANQAITVQEPSAPSKPKSQVQFWNDLEPILFKGWKDPESAWDKLDEDDITTYDALFPNPPTLDLDKLLRPLKRGWQFFPSSSTGVKDGNENCGGHKDLHRFTIPSIPVDSTPSKPSKGIRGKY